MKSLLSLVLLAVMAISANCAEDGVSASRDKEDQSKAAIHFLELISNGQLDLVRDTALSKHCSPKRLKELETRIERVRNNDISDNDIFTFEAQLTDSGFAAVLVRADNMMNPLNKHIHPVALLRRNNQWLPAPLLGSFSNTGYGYDLESEISVKKLETWMGQQKILRESKHTQKIKSEIKSKIIKIEQAAELAEMNSGQITSYFLKQCRNKNTLAIIASIGSAYTPAENKLGQDIEIISKAMQLEPTSRGAWYHLSQACIAQVIETDDKTGKVTVGCFDPSQADKNEHYAFKTITFPAVRRHGKTILHLPSELTDLKNQKRRFQNIDPKLKNKISMAIIKKTNMSQHGTPEQLLEHFTKSINEQNFHDFLRLSVRENEGCTEEDTLIQIAQLWNTLRECEIKKPLILNPVAEKPLTLTNVEYRRVGSGRPFKKKELWMIKNHDSWHILPASMLQPHLRQIVDDTENKAEQNDKVDSMIKILRQQMHEQWLQATFEQIVTTTLPSSLEAPSADEAQEILALLRKHLMNGNIKAYFSQCFILENSDKNKINEHTKRLIRGVHDQLPAIETLGISKKGAWIGISTKTTSKVSKLDDYPLYLFANTPKGPRLFANLDLRYPRNSGRKSLNEQNWNQLKESAPPKSLTTLKAIFDEHIQRCDREITSGQE